MTFGNMTLELNIFNVGSQMGDDDMVHEVNLLESIIAENLESLCTTNPSEPILPAEDIYLLEPDNVDAFTTYLEEANVDDFDREF